MRNIAKEVGIRESAIYNHFSSKNEILNEILERYSPWDAGLNLLTDDSLNELENPQKFLYSFSEKLLNHWNSDFERKMLRLLIFEEFRENSNPDNSLKKLISSLQELWVIIFNEMKKLNIISNIDSEVLANEFVAPLFFIRLEFISGEDSKKIINANDKLKGHINFFWNAIKGE